MGRNTVKAIDENGTNLIFNNLQEASEYISQFSKLEKWKIQLFIAYAISSKTKAFKYKWVPVK
jgi:hypothetical protein